MNPSHLIQQKTPDAWRTLIASGLQLQEIPAVAEALKTWPDELRIAPKGQWSAIMNGASIPSWWPLVRHLILEDDEELRASDALAEIRILDLGSRPGYIDAADLASLSQLRELNIGGARSLDLRELPLLPSLQILSADGTTGLYDLGFLIHTPALQQLFLADTDLQMLDGIDHSPLLEQLHLTRCRSLENLDAANGHPTLYFLDLRWVHNQELVLPALPQLRQLWISADFPMSLDPLSGSPQFDELLVGQGSVAPDLSGLGKTSVRRLTLDKCPFPASDERWTLPFLVYLTLISIPGKIPAASHFPALQNLVVQATENMKDLDFLAGSSMLRFLHISNAGSLADVSALAQLPSLEKVRLLGASPAVLAEAAKVCNCVEIG